MVGLSLSFITMVRFLIGQSPPAFVSSDNPASFSDSILTRTLTYLYLVSLNIWLLLTPSTLCFDWSMGSVPLVESFSDWRNLGTMSLFIFIALFAIKRKFVIN